jgi:hypothetical protein
MQLQLHFYNTRVGLFVARALAISCAFQAITTAAVGSTGVPLTGLQGCVPNQMRLQIQGSRAGKTFFTQGYVMMNVPVSGVSTLQVRNQMMQIFASQPPGMPGVLEDGLLSAIIRMSQQLHKYPPSGTSLVGNIEREIIGVDKGAQWRLDLENLRGHNLKQ